jgi:hypothetical protein
MARPDWVRFSPCLPEVGRLEESTIPFGAARPRPKIRATEHPRHPVCPGHPGQPGRLRQPVDRPGPDRGRDTRSLPPKGAPGRLGRHRPNPTDQRLEVTKSATAQGTATAPAWPRTSLGASWSTIRRPLGPTSESARSKDGSRPTTAYRCRAPSGPSASPVPAHGLIRASIVRNPVGPASARAGSGSTSGETLNRPRRARPSLRGGRESSARPQGAALRTGREAIPPLLPAPLLPAPLRPRAPGRLRSPRCRSPR